MSKIDRKAIKKAIKEGTKRLYTQNLAIKPGEKILIFTDRVNPAERMSREQLEKREMLIDLVQLMVDMAPPDVHVIEVIFDATGAHGKEPPETLWMAAFGTDVVKKIKQEGLWETLLAKSLGPNESERIEKIILNGDTQKLDAVIALSFFLNFNHIIFDFTLVSNTIEPYSMSFSSQPESGKRIPDISSCRYRKNNCI